MKDEHDKATTDLSFYHDYGLGEIEERRKNIDNFAVVLGSLFESGLSRTDLKVFWCILTCKSLKESDLNCFKIDVNEIAADANIDRANVYRTIRKLETKQMGGDLPFLIKSKNGKYYKLRLPHNQ